MYQLLLVMIFAQCYVKYAFFKHMYIIVEKA